MKIWCGYGSEHSANLVIIGKFKTENDARSVRTLIADMTRIVREEQERGKLDVANSPESYPEEILDIIKTRPGASMISRDCLLDLLYDYDMKLEGDRVVVETEETNIEAFLMAMLSTGARIETYSAHDYPGKYGR
ncbi:MAG: hypothetical protein KJZ78_09805 [Bryobacteraceae bacterium]|nr:hypothetical protein [Bryobacteraceae bacterium]